MLAVVEACLLTGFSYALGFELVGGGWVGGWLWRVAVVLLEFMAVVGGGGGSIGVLAGMLDAAVGS